MSPFDPPGVVPAELLAWIPANDNHAADLPWGDSATEDDGPSEPIPA